MLCLCEITDLYHTRARCGNIAQKGCFVREGFAVAKFLLQKGPGRFITAGVLLQGFFVVKAFVNVGSKILKLEEGRRVGDKICEESCAQQIFFYNYAKIMHFVENLYLVIRCTQSIVGAAPLPALFLRSRSLNPPLAFVVRCLLSQGFCRKGVLFA